MDNIIILNESFESEAVVDVFESLLWTVRYKDAGDFELYTPINEKLLSDLKVGRHLFDGRFLNAEANEAHLMIIETLELDDTHLKVTGRSLKSLLDRRIIWGQKVINKNTTVLSAITTLLNENLISPSIADRRISNFVFDTSTGDFGTYEEDTQYEGNSLLEVMNDLCTKHKFGYSVVYNFTDGKYHMRLTNPVDHSYEQLTNPPVVFSANFNNLKSSKYLESVSSYKNVAFISGEKYSDDETGRFHQTAVIGSGSGVERREIFVDASSVRHELDDGTIYSSVTYQSMIEEKGKEELNKEENRYQKKYEGEADNAANNYVFMRDYNIGDTVEIITRYGMSSTVRVSEMVLNISTSGMTFVPTFEAIEEDES